MGVDPWTHRGPQGCAKETKRLGVDHSLAELSITPCWCLAFVGVFMFMGALPRTGASKGAKVERGCVRCRRG